LSQGLNRRHFIKQAAVGSVSMALAKSSDNMFRTHDSGNGQDPPVRVMAKGRPFVNQAGYNLNERKRFVCPGAPDGTLFRIVSAGKTVYSGRMHGYAGKFTDFNPESALNQYVIEVDGFGQSVPFRIASHLMEAVSSRLAYQFFIDVRGGFSSHLSPANVTGGGPSRDGGGLTLEATFEGLLYASNPALFDRWTKELRYHGNALYPLIPPPDDKEIIIKDATEKKAGKMQFYPDLIKLILWHGEWAYTNHEYNGRTGGFESRAEGYEDWIRQYGYTNQSLQSFDYQNLLDQLAAVCAFYRPFLKPRLAEDQYQKYRQACLTKWETYDRQKEVRYWIKSRKWIDKGRLEFNEQGNAFGQGLLRNLLMYVAEKQERDGQPERFLHHAQNCAEDIIKNWDFNNPVHTWRARNAEHITPQALALFQLIAPGEAPSGTKDKLAAWRDYVVRRSRNLWEYRTHSDIEWAHPKSKEIGTVAGMAGSMFAVAEALNDPELRGLGWSQVNFVFGCNPAGAHLSHKSRLRVAMRGYWDGVEIGWPFGYPIGTGYLGAVRGTLDGSPTDAAFPYNPEEAALCDQPGVYGTEGWAVSNRAWMTAVTFSTLGSTSIRLSRVREGTVRVELKAALNLDPRRAETGWVLWSENGRGPRKIIVRETGPDTGVFAADVSLRPGVHEIEASYGFLAARKTAHLMVQS
jgi:hypothetical protein